MENLRAGVPAVNCMIDRIIVGETIVSVTSLLRHVECSVKVTLKSVMLLPPLLVCFTPDTPSRHSICFEASIIEHRRPRLRNVILIALASRLWHSSLPPSSLPLPLFTGHAVRCGFGTSSWISAIYCCFPRLRGIFNQSREPSSTPLTSPVAPPDPPSSLSPFSPAGDTAPPSICS
jgi:hypothetical protein